jgi:hypothetical protein
MEVVLWVLSLAVGGAITWAVSRRYYKAAARDLNESVETLRKLLEMNLTLVANQGDAEYEIRRDGTGRIIGLSVTTRAPAAVATFSAPAPQIKVESGKPEEP